MEPELAMKDVLRISSVATSRLRQGVIFCAINHAHVRRAAIARAVNVHEAALVFEAASAGMCAPFSDQLMKGRSPSSKGAGAKNTM
jgi:hypothetical protein